MNCPNCKQDNPTDARYCARCGIALPAQGQDAASGQKETTGQGAPLPEPRSESGLLPRKVGELIADAFLVYQRGFGAMFRISLVAQVPFFIADFIPNEAIALSVSMVGLLTGILAHGAIARAVCRQYLGLPVTATGSYVVALNNGLPLLANGAIFAAAVLGTLLLSLILIGIPLLLLVAVSWFFYTQATMIDHQGAVAALTRSAQLVRGSWWRVLGIGMAFIGVLAAVVLVASAPGLLLQLANKTAGGVLVTLGGALVTPLGYVGATLVYFDLRVRKEGYTLEKLTSEIE